MNKFSKGLLITALSTSILGVAACGNQSDSDKAEGTKQTTQQNTSEKQVAVKSKYPFPSDTAAKGGAKIVLTSDSGSSENGNVPVVFSSNDDILIQLGLDAYDFDGGKQSFIYVDKIFSASDQFGEETTTSVDLEQDKGHLKPGVHTVSIVQFDNDDPKKGSVTAYTEAKYEVKEKK